MLRRAPSAPTAEPGVPGVSSEEKKSPPASSEPHELVELAAA